jgi:hypothetical protein
MKSSTSILTGSPPGCHFFIFALYINTLFAFRGVLFQWGFSVPLRTISLIYGIVLMFSLSLAFGAQALKSQRAKDERSVWFQRQTWWWLTICLLLGLWGMARQNPPAIVVKEWMLFTSIGLMAYCLADSRMAPILFKHLTIIFYISFPFVAWYYETPGVIITEEGAYTDINFDVSYRYLDTVSYNMRFTLAPAILLGAASVVLTKQNRFTRIAQAVAFVSYFGLEIILFKFRGAVIGFSVLILTFIVAQLVLSRSNQKLSAAPVYLLVIVALGVLGAGYIQKSALIEITERFSVEGRQEGIFESRIAEAAAMFSELGSEALVGRGLGGGFDASGIINQPVGQAWTTMHFGALVLILKGGVLLFLSFAFYIGPSLLSRGSSWYKERLNIVATILLPFLIYNWAFNPFSLSHEFILSYTPLALVFGRLGCNDRPKSSLPRGSRE